MESTGIGLGTTSNTNVDETKTENVITVLKQKFRNCVFLRNSLWVVDFRKASARNSAIAEYSEFFAGGTIPQLLKSNYFLQCLFSCMKKNECMANISFFLLHHVSSYASFVMHCFIVIFFCVMLLAQ